MDPERWKRIESILESAFELEGDDRVGLLASECGDDHALRAEVEAMLAAEASAPAFLETDAASFAALAFELDRREDIRPPAEIGETLGAYRLLKEIGHGGMSVVFLAERADGEFDREVAVKMLRHFGGDREERIRRFRAERQILATLRHPNIAQVFGGGVTDGGWPYLVMELIDGIPITDFCDDHQLSLEARLALFDDVCAAVQHAHQHFVVHRDLKPANILVTPDGEVKLLDFGIAKLIDDHTIESAEMPMTATGMQVLTPQYAAPEQVRGQPISTASDVYALGLVLYELMTGARPYDVAGHMASEVERIVCETNVARPSAMIASLEGGGGKSGPTRWLPDVEGDLDMIVLKALRKDPATRYGSAQELREDLGRYGAGLPVRAQPLTPIYRAKKFLSRNRIAVGVASLIAALLVTFAVLSAIQQRETARQRDAAQLQAQKAAEVTEFMLGLFSANHPSEALGDTLTAQQLLERGLVRAGRLESQPTVRAAMLDVMGRAYHSLGHFGRADTLLAEALELLKTAPLSEPRSIVQALSHLGSVRTDRANYRSADSLLMEALERSKAHGNVDSLSAVVLNELARLRSVQGEFAAAESLHTEVLRIRRDTYGTDHPLIGQSLHNVALALGNQGRHREADSLFVAALRLRQRLLPAFDPDISSTITELAGNRELLGDLAAADSLLRMALEMQRHVLGDDHPTVSSITMRLANVLAAQGHHAEAELLHVEVLETRTRRLGPTHPDVGESLFSLAYLASLDGDYDRADRYYREAIVLWRPTLGEEHPYVTLAYNNLANVHSNWGRYREAVELHRIVLKRHEEKFGPESPHVAVSLGNLGDALTEVGSFDEAEPYIRTSLEMNRSLFGQNHARTGDSYSQLAKIRQRQGLFEEALALHDTSLVIRRAAHGPDHPRVAYSLHPMAVTLWKLGREEEAESMFESALANRLEGLGENHPETQRLVADYLSFCRSTNRSACAAELENIAASPDR